MNVAVSAADLIADGATALDELRASGGVEVVGPPNSVWPFAACADVNAKSCTVLPVLVTVNVVTCASAPGTTETNVASVVATVTLTRLSTTNVVGCSRA